MAKTKHVALLRGINVGSTRKVPMADLRALCEQLGFEDPKTYIQSGNVVFTAAGTPEKIGAALEKAILAKFKLDVPVIVRGPAGWKKLVAANPFEAESKKEPNRVMLVTSRKALAKGAAAALAGKALFGERIEEAGGGLWIHFPEGAGKSKITPVLVDKACGSPATMRNLNTVLEIQSMLEG